MNWQNVNLNDSYEVDQNLLDPYNFNTLLLEISCNIKDSEITENTVREQAMLSIRQKYNAAIDILHDNLSNITAKAIADSKL